MFTKLLKKIVIPMKKFINHIIYVSNYEKHCLNVEIIIENKDHIKFSKLIFEHFIARKRALLKKIIPKV